MNARRPRQVPIARLQQSRAITLRYYARLKAAVVAPLKDALVAEFRPLLRDLAREKRGDSATRADMNSKRHRVILALARVAHQLSIAPKPKIRVADIATETAVRAEQGAREAVVAADPARAREHLRAIDVGHDEAARLQIDTWSHQQAQYVTELQTDALDRLAKIVAKEVREGTDVKTIAKIIQQQIDVTSNKAMLIARTEVARLNSTIAQSAMQRAGSTSYVWRTAEDERVRGDPSGLYPDPTKTGRPASNHYVLDGQTFRFDDPPVIDVSGITGPPGSIWNCRCVALPVFDEPDESALDRAIAEAVG